MTRTSSTFVLMLGLWWLWHTHLLEVISLRNPWAFLVPLVDAFKNKKIEFGYSLNNIQTVFETFGLPALEYAS
jgi:hypothetical protein